MNERFHVVVGFDGRVIGTLLVGGGNVTKRNPILGQDNK